jgi:hypothetical protein
VVGKDENCTDDELRLEGLRLIDELKKHYLAVRRPPKFENMGIGFTYELYLENFMGETRNLDSFRQSSTILWDPAD